MDRPILIAIVVIVVAAILGWSWVRVTAMKNPKEEPKDEYLEPNPGCNQIGPQQWEMEKTAAYLELGNWEDAHKAMLNRGYCEQFW